MRAALVAALICGSSASFAAAQEPATPRVMVGVASERDRFTYHFTNPSSLDTAGPLIPHFFEQRYVADNVWLVGELHYVAGVRWQTAIGATAPRGATGDDYDTFTNPDGSEIVSGTTGDVRIRSWRISQRAQLVRHGAVGLSVGYRLRVDRSDFGVGHKTVTQNGVLRQAFDVTTRELTTSQVHEIVVGAAAGRPLGSRWRLSVEGDASPTTVARLMVQLPDKYPGQNLVFLAKVLSGSAKIRLTRAGRWPLELSVDAGRTWPYRQADSFLRTRLAVSCAVGLGGRSPSPPVPDP